MLYVDPGQVQADIDDEIVDGTLGHMSAEEKNALIAVEQRLAGELVDRARQLASGPVLQRRTGRFAASIQSVIDVEDQIGLAAGLLSWASVIERIRLDARAEGVFATVFSSDRKASILEYGATLPPHEIDARTARALHFLSREGEEFAAHVHFPGAELRPRPTIHAAFDAMRDEIANDIAQALNIL